MFTARTIRIVAGIAALWQAIGVASYLAYVGLFGGSSPPSDQPDMPVLVHACYALGVFSGLAGAIGLALLRRWAPALLAVSLVALVIQWGWVLAYVEAGSLPLGLGVLAVSAFLVWLARQARRRGMLS